ncbi:phage holin family protein [Luteimonas sp BLCC-B24]|uniref:phage holin family protein n=1 Tax=Luteimonas sp. BLCC-B24 TaxID=3025317 RepID=UPI00234C7012|nr:phage holin family protein [Luteimonas sp. BLCC-B24]MDC7807374.1 phage holin family protein [Luteimonas sp. BLCC-B24]
MTERVTGDDPREDEPAGSAERAPGETPHLDESIRRIRAAAKETASSGLDSGRALRKLISADFALARSALGRGLAWAAVSVVFGASAWLLAMGAAIALLQSFGLSWLVSISITMLVSLVVTGLAAWRVSVFFDYAGMHATRRQLTRLGLFSETSGDDDEDDDLPAPPPSVATTAPVPGGSVPR